ncbi:MAG: DNA-3-methyladenine glycosylase 2 family protein [Paracoccaceae bacterium]|jgi:DNA-3-methyladenine glycosylase II|uniref:DNA-3-methyladenine glycosylase family protein n=1 Tax=unclassified Seohaeicola TaxID=2641111 RepID=UPI00237C10D7|nr:MULTISPECIES: DNA-3-methyladenine glycosylase 2 family protein [unclassified Seohaeicola]MDD9706161.1 DNA-3-methyladenine glycosylase 2 family protein [Seohaeicola sp. 4SK31]MDD9734620.1 DNA-3-methyladenine glycosylase 2 family protein [Seohaeicola sp. SP36]MDF1708017.1 DNA-3-methyladenine glycosylase 2 family protein [Paracoccaceae bacterium]MDM7970972.1 DNA-3-methyladenine glycosylase 2 family protein [Paracoccaceae bacterium]
MTQRIILTDACVAEGVDWLCATDPAMARAYAATGPLPLRRRPDGFAQLLSAIVSQQVSVASARAIWGRLEAAGLTTPESVAQHSEDELRALGLSRQKAAYAHALAAAGIDYAALRDAPTDEVVSTLVAVKGIGIWTAEIYAMFSLGHADVFAPGDLALQEGARMLYNLPDRPRESALRQMATGWSPWRSVAARMLWAYYHVQKQKEGIA